MSPIQKIKLNNRLIGHNEPTFIVAEISSNHGQNFEKAKRLVDVSAKAEVDAIKLQTYTSDTMTIDCDTDYFKVKDKIWKEKTLYNLYKETYMPWKWQPKLKKYAESKGLIFFSTPFDETAVDFLEELNVQLYKVASFEINYIPLLKKIATTKKPVIISRGLASEKDIHLAVRTLKNNGCPAVAVLHCVSSYPATPEQMNLKTITDIGKRFDVIPGLSDHTLTIEIPIASVALGANIIEKHITLSRKQGGLDASFSLEPNELKTLVKSIRTVEKAFGKVTYDIGEKEKKNIIFRRSIFVVKDIKKGEKFNKKNIRVIRPEYGLHPKFYEEIIGKKAKRNLKRGTPLKEGDK